MEEKEIKIIEIYLKEKLFFNDEYYNAIQKLLQAYKQNEKVIYEMADAMEDEHCGVKDIINEEICDHKRCIGTAMQCKNCIINYFRKKC